MGFNWVFVNPIQRPGLSGSLYSIKDYYALNPLLTDPDSPLSPDEQLAEAMDSARDSGVNMMIDLVINHTAIDSPLTTEHPGWFAHDNKGRIAHPYAMDGDKKVIWGDLARLDHKKSPQSEEIYAYFRAFIEHLIKAGFRGFRCDAAYQIPQKVWARLISDIKSSWPDTVFAAETLGCSTEQTAETAQAGFDYIFNSSKWWDFKAPWLMKQYDLFRGICPSISFPESHDTERIREEFSGDINAIKRAYLFSAFFSSGVMIPMGFEHGFKKRLHVVKTSPEDWEETGIDLTSFITDVNTLKRSHGLFMSETHTRTRLYGSGKDVLLLTKESESDAALVAINLNLVSERELPLEAVHQALPGNVSALSYLRPGEDKEKVAAIKDRILGPGEGIVFIGRTGNEA